MAGQQNSSVKTQCIYGADMVANVLKMLPGRHSGQPAAWGPSHFRIGPDGIPPDLMNMPVVGRRHNPAMFSGCQAGDLVRLNRVQTQRVLRTVRLAQTIG